MRLQGGWADESEFIEIHPMMEEINHAIAHLGEWMRPEPVEAPLLLADTASEIRWEPRGQVLVLSPWNYPLFLTLGPLVGAIGAGNVVILKPSEKVPETNRALRAVLADAFSENEVAIIEGEAPVAEALLELPLRPHLLHRQHPGGEAGDGRCGQDPRLGHPRARGQVAGHRRPGRSPVQEQRDAIAWGKFVNAGQTCVATGLRADPGRPAAGLSSTAFGRRSSGTTAPSPAGPATPSWPASSTLARSPG